MARILNRNFFLLLFLLTILGGLILWHAFVGFEYQEVLKLDRKMESECYLAVPRNDIEAATFFTKKDLEVLEIRELESGLDSISSYAAFNSDKNYVWQSIVPLKKGEKIPLYCLYCDIDSDTKNIPFTLCFSQEQYQELARLAKAESKDVSQLVKEYIEVKLAGKE